MKNYLKEIFPAIIISFSFSFMLFIYEPIVMYLSNTSDFWFDIYVLFKNSLIGFTGLFLFILLCYSIIYVINKFVFKEKKNILKIFEIIGFLLFIVTYIQGNYLSGSLPTLDGNIIDWNLYKKQQIYSLILLVIASMSVIILAIKLGTIKTVKYLKYASMAVCVMLFVSLLSTCLTTKGGFIRKRYPATSTARNISDYSSNNNLIVLVLDSIDSETMNNIVKDSDYEKIFSDFTYYPNTVGAYAFTRDNVPLLLSGYWSENKKDFYTFFNESMDKSKLIKNLKDNNYNINIYYEEMTYDTEKAHDIKNLSFDSNVHKVRFLKNEIKYDMFKYLPFYIKKYSRIETMDFNSARKEISEKRFNWLDITFLNEYLNNDVNIGNKNEFKYIHLEGAHYPFDCDSNFNIKENGTYEDKIEASINLIDKYLRYLKANNIYDNSAIIIMADHGFWWDIDDNSLLKRQNPILYIKGIDEKHKSMNTSDVSVSFGNFQDIYANLIKGIKTNKLFDNIDTSKPRRFLLQRVGNYDIMEEFYQYGYAKKIKTTKTTEKMFELEKK